jgi:hypothetical protein
MGIVEFVWKITPFTTQIFEFFIAMSFIYESIRDLVEPYTFARHVRRRRLRKDAVPPMRHLVIGMVTFYICWTLHFAETWVSVTRPVRTALVAYNMAIAVIVATASLSYLPGINQTEGGSWFGASRCQSSLELATDRSNQRLVDLTDPFSGIGPKGIFGALFPAFMLYLLSLLTTTSVRP